MQEKIKIVYKKSGQTPLDCINEAKKANSDLLRLPLTYAGRLDPLAEGVLVLLIGDECLKKDEYLKLPKEYEVTILFGFSTDTYDLMGKVIDISTTSELLFKRSSDEGVEVQPSISRLTSRANVTPEVVPLLRKNDEALNNHINFVASSKQVESKDSFKMVWPSLRGTTSEVSLMLDLLARKSEDLLNESFDGTTKQINKFLPQFTGRITQSYPPYSSRTVNGKPLYKWAREGKLNEIIIPSHDVFVESIEIINEGLISGEEFLNKIKKDIALVSGDFRQEEIINLWKETLKDKKEEQYKTITLKISCGSGVYVRGIAHELGIALGVPALALHIKRTKVGEYKNQ